MTIFENLSVVDRLVFEEVGRLSETSLLEWQGYLKMLHQSNLRENKFNSLIGSRPELVYSKEISLIMIIMY